MQNQTKFNYNYNYYNYQQSINNLKFLYKHSFKNPR